jgi:arylsulfatase A-like enzyme
LLAALALASCGSVGEWASRPPNIVLVLADDLGYGDLSVQGHPVIRTPIIDRIAAEGQRWTSFYASAPLCNPSRVALVTGRMPIRIHKDGKNAWANMPNDEATMAEMLSERGYATAYVGKWGLSSRFDYDGSHPNDQGFDDFYGLVGSNDAPLRAGFERTYENIKNSKSADFPISLYRQREAIETPAYQPTLTKRYTEESVRWMREHSESPFFLFLGHSMPHVPIFRSPEFEGRSNAGLYGDVIEEIDWSIGQLVHALEELGVAENTLLWFSSDNGPWRTYFDLGGSPGPLRDGKITAWEGGFRVPGIFWWPGTIAPAVINGIGVNVDLMATIAALAGAAMPAGRLFDSVDLSPTLIRGEPSPRQEWFYYGQPGNLWAARVGQHKLVFESWESLGTEKQIGWRGYANHQTHNPPMLFDLSTDVNERWNIAERNPEVIGTIRRAIKRHRERLAATDQ